VRLILQPTLESVIEINRFVCSEGGNLHRCLDTGKIERAISFAFHHGSYPFSHGGLAKVEGALCFYLVKSHAFLDGNKRTGALVAITFLNMHEMDLEYLLDIDKSINGLAEIIESCAASKINLNQLKDWFEIHKLYLDLRTPYLKGVSGRLKFPPVKSGGTIDISQPMNFNLKK
jgi:death on curing protein